MSRTRSRLHAKVIAVLGAIALGAAAFTTTGAAAATTVKVNTKIRSHPFSGPGCTSPVNLCAEGQIRGTLNGPFSLSVTSAQPATAPGVLFASANVVFHDRRGDLTCTEDFVLNPSLGADQSFAALCQITGGTGRWSGASGYLQGYGTTPPGETDAQGVLVGKIVLPG